MATQYMMQGKVISSGALWRWISASPDWTGVDAGVPVTDVVMTGAASPKGDPGDPGDPGPTGAGFSPTMPPYGDLDVSVDIYPRHQATYSVPIAGDYMNRLVQLESGHRYTVTVEIWAEDAQGACILHRVVSVVVTSYSTGVSAGQPIIVSSSDIGTPLATGAGANINLTWFGVDAFGHPNVEFRMTNSGASPLDVQFSESIVSAKKIVLP